MKKRTLILCLSAILVLSLSSCSSDTEFTGSISFYDGTVLLGSISGTSAKKIADNSADAAKLESFETKENHTFNGWYEDSSLTQKLSAVTYYPYLDISLYGEFLANVTLTLELGEAESIDDSAVMSYSGVEGRQIEQKMPAASKNEYTFAGWKDKATDAKFTWKFFPSSSLVLIPIFTVWPTLSFVTNVTGYQIDPIKVEPGTQVPTDIIDSTKLTKGDMYKFNGWYKEDTFKTNFNFESMGDSSLTIYAQFLAKHTISFMTNVPGYSIESLVGFEGDAILAPSLDKTLMAVSSKYFTGWYEDAAFGASSAQYSFDKMPDNDLTLYAKWSQDPVITLFDVDHTTILNAFNTYEPGSYINLNTYKPIHGNNSFIGWSTTASGNNFIVNPDNYCVPEVSTSIFAVMQTNYDVTVQFVDPYGNALSDVSDETGLFGSSLFSDPSALSSAYLVQNYPSNYGNASDYKLEGYWSSLSEKKYVQFPINITNITTIYAVLAKKVTITLHDSADSLLGSVIGYQDEAYGTDPITTGSNGNYYAYGVDTHVSASAYNYAYSIDDSKNIVLPNAFPSKDVTFKLYFTLVEPQ